MVVAYSSAAAVLSYMCARVALSRDQKLEEGVFYILGEEPVADQQDSKDKDSVCQDTGLKNREKIIQQVVPLGRAESWAPCCFCIK